MNELTCWMHLNENHLKKVRKCHIRNPPLFSKDKFYRNKESCELAAKLNGMSQKTASYFI